MTDAIREQLARRVMELEAERDALVAQVEEARPMVEAHLSHVAMSDFVPECRNAAGKAAAWLARSPNTASLARRDARMKAEALEEEACCVMNEANYLEAFRSEVAGRLHSRARGYRRRAEEPHHD